jgi:hypothetical protein
MVDRPQTTGSKEVRDPIRIRLIGLVAQPAFATPITHDNTINQRNQEIVKPLRLRTFLERNVKPANSVKASCMFLTAKVPASPCC